MVSGRILEKQTALGTILSELLKNTHQHARHGYDSTELDYSVRAVYARYFSADALQASLVTKDEKRLNALEQYIKRLTPQAAHQIKHGTKKLVSGFLEISILDSGPGLPQRWLGRSTAHDPIETEFDALLSCFKKGASSSNKRTKGFGLHNVLNTMIELGGFIRIRSNRLHVFRALDYEVGIRQDPDTGEVKQTFFDWHREFSDKVSAYGAINGSLVSLLIPLGHE
jgi:two-component sensor histidine kinase